MKKLLHALYQPYKWLFFFPYLVVSTIVFALAAMLLAAVANARIASFVGGVIWARLITWLTPVLVEVVGRENIDTGQSYVVISNHRSFYDIFILYGRLGMDIKWIMKRELKKIPFLGIAAETVGHIYVDRSNIRSALALVKAVKSKMTRGTSVVFFPEGTRSKTGEMGAFKKGAFLIAVDLGLPILPVTIIGTEGILPANTMDLFPGRVKVIIHKPVPTAGCHQNDIQELAGRVREVIQSGCRGRRI
ncbi:MAG: lysophospholipid acyltransferase family protein [bacterium]|nr:lysophospholipid acyltransferase family protein [bacterium]